MSALQQRGAEEPTGAPSWDRPARLLEEPCSKLGPDKSGGPSAAESIIFHAIKNIWKPVLNGC